MQQTYQPAADGLSPLLFQATDGGPLLDLHDRPNAAGASGKTTFQFDRRADVDAILDGDSRATYTWTLIDESNGNAAASSSGRSSTTPTTTFQGQLNDADGQRASPATSTASS